MAATVVVARQIAVRFRSTRTPRRFQGVRLQLRTRCTSLQPPNPILQSLDLLLLLADDLKQTQHQRGNAATSVLIGESHTVSR